MTKILIRSHRNNKTHSIDAQINKNRLVCEFS